MSAATVDSKGRILIPEHVRRELGLSRGIKIKLMLRNDEGSVLILKKSVEPDEFIKQTEGFLTDRSAVKVADPLRLKEIWTAP